jgi:hypothetical protein
MGSRGTMGAHRTPNSKTGKGRVSRRRPVPRPLEFSARATKYSDASGVSLRKESTQPYCHYIFIR